MTPAQSHEEAIAAVSGDPGARLRLIQAIVRELAPQAEPIISYRMPAFRVDGAILIYFASFRHHTGIYPPLRPENLIEDLRPYMGPKGNFKFPHNQPLPTELIRCLIATRLAENAARSSSKR